MAIFNGIKIDGVVYDVRIGYETLKRKFEIIAGKNARTRRTTSVRYHEYFDPVGVGYTYQFTIYQNPANRSAYDSLYEVLCEPVETHLIELPFGQSTISFNAHIESGEDTYGGQIAGENVWKGLNVKFKFVEPYEEQP